mmetsp:Transcript_32077/g.125025  ORF Transcript_32077/g.125025 Transcript_32077/m.125025 type:complete len:479 (-) Transcript_32077:167-1603(-)
MDALVKRMDALGGSHVSGLSHYLEWDSIAANWVLFQLHRQAVPHPNDWSIGLVDSRFNVPEVTAMALATSEVARMVSVITHPLLVMTEMQEERYSLGSGWAFLGGLPELDGMSNANYSGLKRIRLMSWIENYLAVVIISCEVRPGIVAVLRIAEVDGRHNLNTWSVVDRETQKIIGTQTMFDRRSCDMCALTGDICDPRVCHNRQSFDELRAFRISLLDKMDNPVYNMRYTMSWLSGRYVTAVGPLPPISVETKCYASGSAFAYALLSVLQSEVEGVHPPRSTFRLVKQAKDEMDYFLGLEDLPMSSAGEEVSDEVSDETKTSEELSALLNEKKSSKDVKKLSGSEGKRHRCGTCGMSFKRAYDMKRHVIAVHQKIRDFKCSHCGRAFTQSGHLNEHVRVSHTGINVFVCPVCKKTFGNKAKRERHIRNVHQNESNFRCEVCKKLYKDKGYLKQHLATQHNVTADAVGELSKISLTEC